MAAHDGRKGAEAREPKPGRNEKSRLLAAFLIAHKTSDVLCVIVKLAASAT